MGPNDATESRGDPRHQLGPGASRGESSLVAPASLGTGPVDPLFDPHRATRTGDDPQKPGTRN